MDVVRNEIAAIGGRVDIATMRGQGTTFTVYLPLTLAVTQAVLVRSGGSLFALSSAMVEQVLRLKAESMAGLYAEKRVEFQERQLPAAFAAAHARRRRRPPSSMATTRCCSCAAACSASRCTWTSSWATRKSW